MPPTHPFHTGVHFDRLPAVRQRLGGIGHSKIYDDIARGVLVPPVKLAGGRVSAWARHEVDAILAGDGDDQLRQLVKELIAARTA